MDKARIDNIFTKGRCIQIPFLQRSYVWDIGNWERFLEDMENVCENKTDYFLGTYIMKQQDASSFSEIGDVRTVIDGQQRFTTILIFFYVLYNKLNQVQAFKDTFLIEPDKYV